MSKSIRLRNNNLTKYSFILHLKKLSKIGGLPLALTKVKNHYVQKVLAFSKNPAKIRKVAVF